MFKKSTIFSEPIAKIKKGRLLKIQKCEEDWCKIETANYSGWIKNNNVWGPVN